MELKEKLDLLVDLPKKERIKAEAKFMAPLSYVSVEELRAILEYLRSKNIVIKNARDIKVVTNELEKVKNNFSILSEVRATDVYEEPVRISYHAISIFQKIKYCMQAGIKYKKEDGSYEDFLFDESLWLEVFNRGTVQKEEGIVTFEPVVEEPVLETPANTDDKHLDIVEFQNAVESVPETTNFAQVKAELESALTELGSLKQEFSSANLEEINFADLEPDVFGGRAA